jgi:HTH-type transcriptional regulator/antitoxin HigA
MIEDTFQPAWASPPGDTIMEILADRGLSLDDLADQIGASLWEVQRLSKGLVRIDHDIAERLEDALGPSKQFWVNRERQYRLDSARLTLTSAEMTEQEWLRQLPVRDMIKFGWIGPARTQAEKIKACLEFFSVPDIQSWRNVYRGELSVAAFRTSPTLESKPGAVSAWLRLAEIKSHEIECASWDGARFRRRLAEIRALTRRKDPSRFLPDLKRICAECGVALIIARAPEGCRASGATKFLSPSKAMIVLSFRYRSDDQFWFTFFHEAGHLLLHGKDALFLEDDSDVLSELEAEANEFAAQMLIPQHSVPALMHLRTQAREIIRFARLIGVSPGIVVGQLQHLQRIKPNRLNSLKRRFSWSDLISQGLSL